MTPLFIGQAISNHLQATFCLDLDHRPEKARRDLKLMLGFQNGLIGLTADDNLNPLSLHANRPIGGAGEQFSPGRGAPII